MDTSGWFDHLRALYGEQTAEAALAEIVVRVAKLAPLIAARPARSAGLTERDTMLITYGDQVRHPPEAPLRTLAAFCDRHLSGLVSCLHLLPFYPYSSDDGFSVVDYRQVNPELGDWQAVRELSGRFRLMYDGVINHISSKSAWFHGFLAGQAPHRDYFIVVEGRPDLSQVVRPRTLPLLSRFATPDGDKAVWTTFSADQIDLNYANPQVLIEIVDLLLFYVAQGAEFIRLDAIAYLWKEIGTACIHLPQTHRVVQLFRAILGEAAPHVKLITETNVPHADNVAYFGNGENEAHLVYNFALPPLVLHTLRTGNASALTRWAAGLTLPSSHVAFFNFLASHDGIGLNPARGILREADIEALVQQTLAHGGRISYKQNPDGVPTPYEMNINYLDALSDPSGAEPQEAQVGRFMAAQAILLALAGLPGIYFHSLFGSRGWPEGVALTGQNRTVNRQKLDLPGLEEELADGASLRHQLFTRYAALLRARAASPAFHPQGPQHPLDCGPAIFALRRTSPGQDEQVLCLQNVTNRPQIARISEADLPADSPVTELVSGRQLQWPPEALPELGPYQTLWLRAAQRT